MTRPLVAIERFFERLFERPATRLFRPRLQPVQLQRRLERAMESERRLSADRTYVPDRYRIALHPADLDQFASYRGTLESDLAEALLLRARQRGYTLLARPRIRLEASVSIERGEIEVFAEVLDPTESGPGPVSTGLRQVEESPPGPFQPDIGAGYEDQSPGYAGQSAGHAGQSAGYGNQPSAHQGQSAYEGQSGQSGYEPQEPAIPEWARTAAAPIEPFPPRRDLNATAAFQVPRPEAPAAIIEIAGPGMPPQRVAFRGGTLRVGRAPENDIVLVDERVSRRHGTFTTRQGALVYTDQGSTNGSFVNGSTVSEIALGTGDVVRLGNTTLTIRPDR